jgi:hypothetical protein
VVIAPTTEVVVPEAEIHSETTVYLPIVLDEPPDVDPTENLVKIGG